MVDFIVYITSITLMWHCVSIHIKGSMKSGLDTILSCQTLYSRIVHTILLETRYQHVAHRFFFCAEESTVHRGRMLPPPMPLAYLILQAIMLQFHHALLCGYNLSHPLVQSDLLWMISYLIGDQCDDAHMAEQEDHVLHTRHAP
jgi:hypothetical protein